MPFRKETIQELQELLDRSKSVMIVAHRSPDCDAVGSSLAMSHLLTKMGKAVQVWMPDEFPDFLSWLPGADAIKIFEGNGKEGNKQMQDADVIMCLDFNRTERTGSMSQTLQDSETPKVLIDHHRDPAEDFTLSFSDIHASSTCELVYRIVDQLGLKELMDKDIATCIYCGLVTDTGSFKYNVFPETHRIAAEMIEYGVDSAETQGSLFDMNSKDRLSLMGYTLSEKLVHVPEKNASYMTLTKEELSRFNYKKGYTEGLVNYGLSIRGVKMTVLASEKDGVIKLSLRSKGDVDVNQIAKERFGGGGHKNAAGARSEDDMKTVISIINEIINELP